MDNDDEVRDRALLYLQVLRQKQKALSSAFILNRKSLPSVVWMESIVVAYVFICLYICVFACIFV